VPTTLWLQASAGEAMAILSTLPVQAFGFEVRRSGAASTATISSVRTQRFQAWVLGAFGLLAVATVASGLFAVVSLVAETSTRASAVRQALGATAGRAALESARGYIAWGVLGLLGGVLLGVGVCVQGLEVLAPGIASADFAARGPLAAAAVAAVVVMTTACAATVVRPLVRLARIDLMGSLGPE